MPPEPMLAHTVLFTLRDNSPEARRKLIADCKRHLSQHPGTVFFAAGTLAEDIDWPISDRDFHVALHLVFRDRAAHDAYQDSPEHGMFLEENEGSWKEIRVLDCYVDR